MSDGQPAARLFFALWPDQAGRQALARAFGTALAATDGRAVPPEHLHLTLEFLGSVPDTQLASLAALGAAVVLPDEAVVLDRLGWWRPAATLVASASAPTPGLIAMQAELRAALAGRGFRVDSRPFRPHVTLARKVAVAPLLPKTASAAWPITELALVESVATPRGSRYRPLARWRRGAGAVDFKTH